jgi:hypothetical protein
MIRVILPFHLQTLAGCAREVSVAVEAPITAGRIIDAIEHRYPTLRGAIRDQVTKKRRPLVRFFADGEDLSHQSTDVDLPETIANGREPFYIVGAIAGG